MTHIFHKQFSQALLSVIFVLAMSMAITSFTHVNEAPLALLGLAESLCCLGLIFYIGCHRREALADHDQYAWIMVFVGGVLIRVSLAYKYYGNHDMNAWMEFITLSKKGYGAYDKSNYTPLIMWILYGIESSREKFFSFLSTSCAIKLFLSFADLIIAFLIACIAKLKKQPALPAVILFFLNPISFLLTGYHGQFENLSALWVLFGFWLYLRFLPCAHSSLWAWLMIFLGTVIKHNIFFAPWAALLTLLKKRSHQILAMGFGILIFLVLFMPHGGFLNNQNVGRYFVSYTPPNMGWGINCFIPNYSTDFKWVFLLMMMVYVYIKRKLSFDQLMLHASLFFLVCATGMGVQYLVMPVFYAAFYPSVFMMLYTVITSLHILGNGFNLGIEPLVIISNAIVWDALLFWFLEREGFFNWLKLSLQNRHSRS